MLYTCAYLVCDCGFTYVQYYTYTRLTVRKIEFLSSASQSPTTSAKTPRCYTMRTTTDNQAKNNLTIVLV